MIHRETAETYHARQAVSAGLLWKMLPPHGCPALAYARSVFNPDPLPPKTSLEFDIGQATHLLTLEGAEFAARSTLIAFDNYQTKEARALRDQAYSDGRVPLRPRDYQLVCALHDALRASEAAELLFGPGENEVSYTWDMYAPGMTNDREGEAFTDRIPCKARADRITPHAIVDLKTVANASPQSFERAMVNDGHHLRAAWYLDGWQLAAGNPIEATNELRGEEGEHIGYEPERQTNYLFVVVAKTPPHLVEIYPLEEGAIYKGRALYRRALDMFGQCRESGVWPGYKHRDKRIGLPTWYEYLLADMVAEGELDL